MIAQRSETRQVIQISGEDRVNFLQGLVTNDVAKADKGLIYAALLNPQGKYLADFFLFSRDDRVFLDVDQSLASGLIQRLSMYKLRADVTIEAIDIQVWQGLGTPPTGAHQDPRHETLGWRYYGNLEAPSAKLDWDPITVAAGVPTTGVELIPNDTYILEAGFERLNGVDFSKGCYVGQEVTARMKHKTELRKGLTLVALSEPVDVGTDVTTGAKTVGQILSQANGQAIAYLRFDRAKPEMEAGDAQVTWSPDSLPRP